MKNIIIMLISFVAMVIVNDLANTGLLNRQRTADISNKLHVLFTPDGYVFTIWGFIYILLAIWLFLQFKNQERYETPQQIVNLFVASCLLNILWLVTWHYEFFVIAQITMFMLLFILILLYKNYDIDNDRFGGRLPFSIYLGWISVATIANMAYTLKYFNVSLGISEVTGTIGLIVVAGALAIVGRYKSNDPYFAMVFVWAIVGIAVANSEGTIVKTAYTVAIIVFIAIIAFFLFNNRKMN